MGHERIGFLPRTQQWREIVKMIEGVADDSAAMPKLLDLTLEKISGKLSEAERDPGVIACFAFIVRFSILHAENPPKGISDDLGIGPGDIGALALTSKLKAYAREQAASLEYLEIATSAAGQALVEWRSSREEPDQQTLFSPGEVTRDPWNAAASAGGFCELSRLFFARFTERSLSYFLDRELAASVGDIDRSSRFRSNLAKHVDDVSKHAFEISKLTQSYSAGWITNVHRSQRATNGHVQKFVSHALGKIRTELQAEARGAE